jgi:hypothetical protein
MRKQNLPRKSCWEDCGKIENNAPSPRRFPPPEQQGWFLVYGHDWRTKTTF